ncbi:damage-inducible protein J [Obesumbacterium proteus]|uniref:damage-inducible protein J n=1 Tax=Obesumbacterium proteus TaxID=82983 RepID=UPI001F3FC9B5|nr:damage-inducible protein J [Obesumbacterium proteus]MCE9885241.1 damage-inducible protein J [Obesumbacterium proteus]MCE9917065.1 damage-inducible protein J [Obesumbacterium proteus]MCE9930366.1 damage-inducible protein J [Obesumbacterium proteus]MCG2875379.1 damage-inducible protein J [Obesumbacterium proteus]
MSTIHFRIEEETKRLAMQAAERKKMTLTELVRERVEELAEEERQFQLAHADTALEVLIEQAFSDYDGGKMEFISDEKMNSEMDRLKALARQGKL